jgi:hypothetical protein
MKRLTLVLVLVVTFALAFTVSAWAASTTYIMKSSWSSGQGYGWYYSSSWWQNAFSKSQGFDTTVTFIDNVSYGWHATRRDASTWTVTHWLSSQTKKPHCRSNAYGGWGACVVYN